MEQEDRLVPLRPSKVQMTVLDSPERQENSRPERYGKRIREFTTHLSQGGEDTESQLVNRKKYKRVELSKGSSKPEQAERIPTNEKKELLSFSRPIIAENFESYSPRVSPIHPQPGVNTFSGIFSNPSWRMRTQRTISNSTESPQKEQNELKGIPKILPQSDSNSFTNPTKEESTLQKHSQKMTGLNSEVSTNFVRKDLKSRGSYKFRSNSARSRRKRTKDILLARESTAAGTNSSKKQEQVYGLASFGLDPLQLFLDHSSNPKKPQSDESHQSHPLCPGHQMAAKLCTVRKSGPNKVTELSRFPSHES